MSEDLFGPLIDGGMIERSVQTVLQRWLDTYLAEIERRNEKPVGAIERPKSWNIASDFTKDAEDALPAIVIVSPGLGDRPVKDGYGEYRAPWDVAVGAVVSAGSEVATRDLAMLYGLAIRAVVVQKGALEDTELDGASAGCVWLDESYRDWPEETRRSLMAVREVFSVEVDGAVNADLGPGLPEPDTDHDAPHTATVVEVETDLGIAHVDSAES